MSDLDSLVREFRAEADQHEGEARSASDQIERARHNAHAATWRSAADSLERLNGGRNA